MTTIANKILKFESMIKKTIITNNTFVTVVTFSKINSYAYINYFLIQLL